jgi:hypothetical protein
MHGKTKYFIASIAILATAIIGFILLRNIRTVEVPEHSNKCISFVTGELLVRLNPGVTRQQLDTLSERLNVKVDRPTGSPELGIFLIKVTPGQEEMIIKDLESSSIIKYAELNQCARLYNQ